MARTTAKNFTLLARIRALQPLRTAATHRARRRCANRFVSRGRSHGVKNARGRTAARVPNAEVRWNHPKRKKSCARQLSADHIVPGTRANHGVKSAPGRTAARVPNAPANQRRSLCANLEYAKVLVPRTGNRGLQNASGRTAARVAHAVVQ